MTFDKNSCLVFLGAFIGGVATCTIGEIRRARIDKKERERIALESSAKLQTIIDRANSSLDVVERQIQEEAAKIGQPITREEIALLEKLWNEAREGNGDRDGDSGFDFGKF